MESRDQTQPVYKADVEDRRIYNGSAGHDAILKRKLARMQRTLCHVICNYGRHVIVAGDGRVDDGGDGRQFVLVSVLQRRRRRRRG